jgi:hypothetical protein
MAMESAFYLRFINKLSSVSLSGRKLIITLFIAQMMDLESEWGNNIS